MSEWVEAKTVSTVSNCSPQGYDKGYQQGNEDAYTKIENEINYLLNCGMGKKKGLEHLLKICKEQKNE